MKTQCKHDLRKSIIFFLVGFFVPFAVNAQLAPVPSKFHGEWFFEHAEIMEGSADDPQSYYTPRPIPKEELSQKQHLTNVPLEITFSDGFSAFVLTNAQRENVFANVNVNVLEFRDANAWEAEKESDAPTAEDMEKFSVVLPQFYNLKLSDGTMSLQYFYSYSKDDGSEKNGVITVYYKPLNPLKGT